MQSIHVDAFFSCSFKDADAPVNDYFRAICRALDVRAINVSTGYSKTPPTVAKKKIGESKALIAVCVRRNKISDDKYAMPDAVRDEISFAVGLDKPALLFVESGVELAGFAQNYGTYLTFDRAELATPAFMEKAIEAIHRLKLESIPEHLLSSASDISGSFAEYINHSVRLIRTGDDLEWSYSTAKKMVFTKDAENAFFNVAYWAEGPAKASSDANMPWSVEIISASPGLQLNPKVKRLDAQSVEARLCVEPNPKEGDFIEYIVSARSKYFNPLWMSDVRPEQIVDLGGDKFSCADGIIAIQNTQKCLVEFRFPRSYGLTGNDLRPFVASYANGIDYEIDSERRRSTISVDYFASELVARFEVESPLLGHFYGFAWNAPEKIT